MIHKRQLILDRLLLRPDSSQRDLALSTGISLGQVNLIIRILCDDGLLTLDNVDKRKKNYSLTQRGLAERARLSNDSILSTIKNYRKIKLAVSNLLDALKAKGFSEFVLEGQRGELHDVITEVVDDVFKGGISLTWGPAEPKDGQVILNLDRRFIVGENTVNVLNELRL